MIYIIFSLLAFLPLIIGISIFILLNKSRLAAAICLFLVFATCWQLGVSTLYAERFFSEQTILLLFQWLRFGMIFLSPTIFYISYIIVNEMMDVQSKQYWQRFVNKKTALCQFLFALLSYIIGLTSKGVTHVEMIDGYFSQFYFPVSGELSWIIQMNILLFFINSIICFFTTMKIENAHQRHFVFYFNIFTLIGFAIGVFNFFPQAHLLPSVITIIVFAISVLILSVQMHIAMMNSMNKELMEQQKYVTEIINLNPNYIYAKNEQGQYTLVNEAFAALQGIPLQQIIGKTDEQLAEYVQLNVVYEAHVFNENMTQEEMFITRDGKERWLQTAKIPLRINETLTELAVSTDITKRKQYEQEIMKQAYHDALTCLPNRRMFNKQLNDLLVDCKDRNKEFAVIFLDLDRFKYINDSLGHDVGDLLLIAVAERVKRFLAQYDEQAKVYRLGGDEFTIVLPHYTKQQSEHFAQQLVELFHEKFVIGSHENFMTPSIGISMYPQDGDDVGTLIKHADTAMYHVKANGKGNYQSFDETMQQQFYRKMMIEHQMRLALERQEFELFYQPIVDVHTDKVIGMEALIRWQNNELGFLGPDEFIPIAEETNLIVPMGKWIMDTALKQQKKWAQQGYELKMSINISVKQLLSTNFIEDVQQLLRQNDVNVAFVNMEITESIAMYEHTVIERLEALKKLGVSLSMDDFGTGYSSLSYLNKYPLDSLKIDKSFVLQMEHDDESKAIVQAVVAIAKQLQLNIIAEGIETKHHYDYLAQIGCHYGQGYYIERPLRPEALTNILEHNVVHM